MTTDMRTAGFTLLETLIAMVLLAFLTLGLTTSLRLGLAYPTVAGAGDRLGPITAVQAFLRRELSSALSLPAAAWQGVAFEGGPHGLEFVAAMPERAADPGLHEIALYLENGRLMLRWRHLNPPGAANQKILLDHVAAVDLAYWGGDGPGSPASWRDGWHARPVLPAMVRIRVKLADGADLWPDLVVALPTAPDEEARG
jgi:prepilin-type N-terminal cleavage/methylation domain-containing protein